MSFAFAEGKITVICFDESVNENVFFVKGKVHCFVTTLDEKESLLSLTWENYISFMHNALSIVFVRIPVSYFAAKMFTDTLFPMGLAAPLGSVLSVIVCLIAYAVLSKRQKA